MKTYRWISFPIILAAAGIWSWHHKGQAGDASNHAPEANALNSSPSVTKFEQRMLEEIIERMRQTKKKSLAEEAVKLLAAVRSNIAKGDAIGFHSAMDEILYRYEGDPNPLVFELIELLNHDDPEIRIYIADIFLLTNIETDTAKRTLLEIVRSPVAFISKEDKEEKEIIRADENITGDLRIMAANVIAIYGLKEASDDLWNLYKKTKDKDLVNPLCRLNDPRIIDELRADAVKNLVSIENMKLVGEYRYEAALPELKRRYADKKLSADLRFRNLFPLWRITGEGKYFDEFAASFLPTNIPVAYLAIGGEREHQYLIEMLRTERSDQLYEAAMALHLRFHDDASIKKKLIGYFQDMSSSNWGDGILARRLVGNIDDAELTKVAKDYEDKYPTGYYDRDVIYKKGWRYPEWEERLFMR